MKSALKILTALLATSALLAGCAVYEPPQAYYQAAPVYVQPAPVYVRPAPVYVEPPVTFGLNFGWWGGGHRHRW